MERERQEEELMDEIKQENKYGEIVDNCSKLVAEKLHEEVALQTLAKISEEYNEERVMLDSNTRTLQLFPLNEKICYIERVMADFQLQKVEAEELWTKFTQPFEKYSLTNSNI